MKLNSIIFHTSNLKMIRHFYEQIMELKIGTFEKNNETVPDCSDKYVNYQMNDLLLCFEEEAGRCDLGTIVMNVDSVLDFQKKLENLNIQFTSQAQQFLKIKDPDGRTLIIEKGES